ncbi:uncharacterized protein EI97DRAFT_457376 [Westerdykella ornata]|uniref:RNA polymerase I-specific transcription initiation factor RRN6-like protein n=1 Tax=Westerdykella ornata TaxID=318751 RepID=A0A6A6JL88_WESOR|nr:uncharacterized protein EI97DRAFT_457376 [Westerdykella ornata]KAF2277351.1 hypothetical protein EI97DRAFT_457376 [Westerdykella ornata]
MANTGPAALNYGHYGQATYSSEHGTWIFDRQPEHRGIIRQLGSWKKLQQPCGDPGSSHDNTSGCTFNSRNVRQAARAIGRENPDLVPSIDILPELALLSAAVTSSLETFDPAVGDSHSFGSVVTEGRFKHTKRVIAVVAGENGNLLRLTSLEKERQGWEQDRSIWLELPSISEGESGYWSGDATPIQQVCFAHGDDRSAFLAVRFNSKTVVFRPMIRESPKPANRSRFYELPPSRVDSNPILTISLRQTGGEPHADISFNPGYQRQLGMVDRKGRWSVWDIEGGHRYGTPYTLKTITRGLLSNREDDSEDEEAGVREDGWARILWVGDVNTIIVCNRRRLELYGVTGGETVRLQCPQPIAVRSDDWILDVRNHATNAHQFFLLTSTHLLLMAVTCQGEVVGRSDLVPGANIVLSWTHFRGLDDITLRLSVPALSEDESTVLLFSQLNTLITIFSFRAHALDPACTISSSDPQSLVLADLPISYKRRVHIMDLHMELIPYRQDVRQPSTGPGNMYLERGVTFYRISVTLSDYSIHQALFYVTPTSSNSGYQIPLFVEPLSWNYIVQSNAGDFQSATLVKEDDDFVTLDGLQIEAVTARASKYRNGRLRRFAGPRFLEMPESADEGARLSLDSIYDNVLHGEAPTSNAPISPTESQDIDTLIDRVRRLLLGEEVDEGEAGILSRGTLFELPDSNLVVSDVDNASSLLEALVSPVAPRPLQQIARTETLHLGTPDSVSPTLSQIYDGLLEHWIASLPPTVPSSMRRSKEEIARRVAAEIMLASFRGSHSGSVGAETTALMADEYNQSSLPVPLGTASSQLTASQPDVVPHSRDIADPVSRLSHRLKFTKASPTSSSSIKQVLMHWQPGKHPGTYDWTATTQAVNEEFDIGEDGEEVDDDEGQKTRDRRRRKAERRLKREDGLSDVGHRQVESQPVLGRDVFGVNSSPPPAMGWGMSSQTQNGSQSQSQNQGLSISGGFVQSQVEPGRHGGRPLLKKKKKGKNRVSGF